MGLFSEENISEKDLPGGHSSIGVSHEGGVQASERGFLSLAGGFRHGSWGLVEGEAPFPCSEIQGKGAVEVDAASLANRSLVLWLHDFAG